jgi:hypothetical protein
MLNDGIELFFDEGPHKYTDNRGNTYISTTTLIGSYEEKFDTKKMARICELSGRKGNPKYVGKTAKMLEIEWATTSKEACDYGNEHHNYLEESVKASTGFRTGSKELIRSGRLLTVSDVITNPGFGELGIDYLIQTKINVLYPSIFNVIVALVKQGYRLYAEIGVFLHTRLISGLIDLFLIKGKEFIIIDWKTNRDDISYEAGYWEKDVNGNSTTNFVRTNKLFKTPLSHLAASVGNKYGLQLSTYAYLVEQYGLTLKAMVLCHLRRVQVIHFDGVKEVLVDRVDMHPIKYLKDDVHCMIEHYHSNRKLNGQIEITM